MKWGVSRGMPRLRRAVDQARKIDAPLRDRALSVATAVFGDLASQSEPVSTINLSVFAILTDCSPPTWFCRPAASQIINETAMHSIPSESPRMLRSHGLVEVRRAETGERLWGDYASLAWYLIEDTIFLVGFSFPDGYAVARWTPHWTGADIDSEMPGIDLTSQWIANVGEHVEFARAAARYLVTLALLAEVENGPLRIDLERKTRWHHVYAADRPSTRVATTPTVHLPDESRIGEPRPIRGHVKRQRYGEGNALTKWIYVQTFTATRYVAARWAVSKRENA